MVLKQVKEIIKNEDSSDYKVENDKGDIRVKTKMEQEVVVNPFELKNHIDELEKEHRDIENDISEDGIKKRKLIADDEIEKLEEQIKQYKEYKEKIGTEEEINQYKERQKFLKQELDRLWKIFNEAHEQYKEFHKYFMAKERIKSVNKVLSNWNKYKKQGYTEEGIVKTFKDLEGFFFTKSYYSDIEVDGNLDKKAHDNLIKILKKHNVDYKES